LASPSSANRQNQQHINRLLDVAKGFQGKTPSWLTDILSKLIPLVEIGVTRGSNHCQDL